MPPPPPADVAALIANLLTAAPAHRPHASAPNVRLLDDMLSAIVSSLRADLPPSPRPSPDAASNAALVAALLGSSGSSARSAALAAASSSSSAAVRHASIAGGGAAAAAATASAAGTAGEPRAKRAPRKKRYADAAPSTHCHVCCRLTTALPTAVCRNIRDGTCRKVVCRRCITEHGWDWRKASETPKDWICPHCVDECGTVRAHCWVYKKTNTRRKMNGLRNKNRRAIPPPLPPLRPDSRVYFEGAPPTYSGATSYEE